MDLLPQNGFLWVIFLFQLGNFSSGPAGHFDISCVHLFKYIWSGSAKEPNDARGTSVLTYAFLKSGDRAKKSPTHGALSQGRRHPGITACTIR